MERCCGADSPYTPAFNYLGIGTFGNPYGMAVDANGNVFVADRINNTVYEIVAVNGSIPASPTINTLVSSGLNDPTGVALDSSDNIYVADTGNNAVKEILAAGGYTTVKTLGTGGYSYPTGVAVDRIGNVYVADNVGAVSEIPLSCIQGANNSTCMIRLGISTTETSSYPGIAVDGSGNVYVADQLSNLVSEIPLSCINGANNSSCVTTLGGGFSQPIGIAFDGSGNIYVADQGDYYVKEMPAGCASSSCVTTLSNGSLIHPFNPIITGVAVDAHGNVFIADDDNDQVDELLAVGGIVPPFSPNFGSVAVGSTKSLTLTFTLSGVPTVQTPELFTQGAAGLDFADAGTGTCTTNGPGHSYSNGDTCTVTVNFTPTHPGQRLGAVQLLSANSPIGTVDIYGSGVGPQVNFSLVSGTSPSLLTSPTAPLSTLGSGFYHPTDVAVDAIGNVYVADYGDVHNNGANGAVYEIPAGNGTPRALGSGFLKATGVAVDSAGNVYVGDTGHAEVKEILAVNGSIPASPTIVTLGGGFGTPKGVAVDASGNVYVGDDSINHAVYEMSPNCTSSACVTTLGGLAFSAPQGVAVDGSGNVYVADYVLNKVFEMSPNCTSSACVTTLGSSVFNGTGSHDPIAVAVDGVGNVYVGDQYTNAAYEILAVNGSIPASPTINTLASGFGFPQGVAVDSRGNVYVADSSMGNTGTVDGLDYVDPPILSFASTPVGATSNDSPQTVTLKNAGNAALTFPIPSSGFDPAFFGTSFTLNSNGGSACPLVSSNSSSPGTLAAGSSCTLPISFAPTAFGPNPGSLVLIDNNLNAPGPSYAPQSIMLVGTATQGTQTITFTQPSSPVTFGVAPITLSATGGASGNSVTFSIVSGPATVSGSTLTITGVGTVVVAANQAGNTNYSAATQVTKSITVNQASQTITFTQPTSPVTYGVAPITLSATGGASGNSVTFSVVSGPATVSGSTLTITGVGTVVVAANQAGNTNYSAATQVTKSITVTQATQTITFTQPSSPVTFGVAPITLSATGGASGNAVTFSVVSGPATVSGSTLTITGVGTVVVAANQTGNTNYSAATQVTKSITVTQATQTITFTQPTSPVTYGVAPITLSATGGGSGNAVTFNVVSGPATVSGSTLTITGVGTVVVAANQAGNTNYSAATQVTKSITVNAATSTLSFTAIPAQTFGAAPFTVSATSASSGAVTYSVSSGPATISGATVTLTGAGSVTLLASQAASGNYTTATANVTFVVNPATATVGVASNSNPVLLSNAVILTATVSSSAGTPTGTVSFLDGTTPLGTGSLAGGVATYTTSSLAVATHSITAVYSGSTNFSPATSPALSQVVEDFNVIMPSIGAQTVVPGGAASYPLSIGPSNGIPFPAPITLATIGLPPGATAIFTPSTVPAGSSLTNVLLSVQLPPVTASLDSKQPSNSRQIPSVLWGILLLPFATRLRKAGRRLGRVLSVLLLLVASLTAIAGLSGCGNNGYFGQTPTTYTIQVIATSGSLSHTIDLYLTVE